MKAILALFIASILLFGCASSAQNPQAGSGAGNGGSGVQGDGGAMPVPGQVSDKVVVIEMAAKQFDFSPSTITVQKGDRVRLIITADEAAHGFSLPDFGVGLNIGPLETKTVEFTADKTGTFTFRCSVFCGPGHGSMKGTLIVEE